MNPRRTTHALALLCLLLPMAALAAMPHMAAQVPARGDVFLETSVDDLSPYVQQSVGVSVRLHYATPLLSGELSQDAPEGASLQRVGEDVQSSRQVGERRYHVVERRYLLVPERSGELRLPPARFRGRSSGNFFNDLFGTERSVSAHSQGAVLQVRAQPPAAPQPWLPLHGLELRYRSAPSRARVGEAVEIVVEAQAQGATGAQFPDIPAPSVPGAQVFAERAQASERFVDGRPHVSVVRRFSVVPLRPGALDVPGVAMEWWDVVAGRARQARLPDLELEAEPADAGASAVIHGPDAGHPATAPAAAGDAIGAIDSPASVSRWWRALALVLAVLWFATLAWAVWLRWRRSGPDPRAARTAAPGARAAVPARPVATDLRRVLDTGSFDEAVRTLERMAVPPASGLDQVIVRLSDPRQRAALEDMRRALWAGAGDPATARAELRTAFRQGPAWASAGSQPAPPLAPLYPPRRPGH
ncbi:protein BatD [Pseudoxanthomonas koreensis]|uniref:protein BatD n=2 Tax=Pseudoxanthomonas koreensis TaxID=266061 RepID=UPI0035A605F9